MGYRPTGDCIIKTHTNRAGIPRLPTHREKGLQSGSSERSERNPE